jgi:hypothetical protein
MRHPITGQLTAVPNKYSLVACILCGCGVSWVWAFAKKAYDFGWFLLVYTFLGLAIALVHLATGTEIVGDPLMFNFFCLALGFRANRQIIATNINRGFIVVSENLEAPNKKSAISKAANSDGHGSK